MYYFFQSVSPADATDTPLRKASTADNQSDYHICPRKPGDVGGDPGNSAKKGAIQGLWKIDRAEAVARSMRALGDYAAWRRDLFGARERSAGGLLWGSNQRYCGNGVKESIREKGSTNDTGDLST